MANIFVDSWREILKENPEFHAWLLRNFKYKKYLFKLNISYDIKPSLFDRFRVLGGGEVQYLGNGKYVSVGKITNK